jgi:hypothetical protein
MFRFACVVALALLGAGLCVSAAQTPVNPKTWSYDTGYAYLLYSYAAYCPENNIKAWNCKWCQYNDTVWGFKNVNLFLVSGELVFVGYNADYKQIVVSFRGSSDIANWLADFDITQVDYSYCSGCQVHKGFYDTWQGLKPFVIPAVQSLYDQFGYEVVVTGHSLGGAVATLASVDIKKSVGSNTFLWTYGCPRVGNPDFATWFPTGANIIHVQRVVNWHDVVPHTPNEWQGFRHIPQESWEQKNPQEFIVCDPNNGEDPNCSDSVVVTSVSDHLDYYGLEESC